MNYTNTMTPKFIEKAIKEIDHAIEWETLEGQHNEVKFWLELAYSKGRVSAFKEMIKHDEETKKLFKTI